MVQVKLTQEQERAARDAYLAHDGDSWESVFAAIRAVLAMPSERVMKDKMIERMALELVDALDRCEGAINGAFGFQAIHCASYGGPTYGKELDVLRQALKDRAVVAVVEERMEPQDVIDEACNAAQQAANELGLGHLRFRGTEWGKRIITAAAQVIVADRDRQTQEALRSMWREWNCVNITPERYDCTQDDTGYELGPARMIKANDGDYVRYADVEETLRLAGELAEVLRDLNDLTAGHVGSIYAGNARHALAAWDKAQKGQQ